MSIKLTDSVKVNQQKPLEDKYFNELVPYISTSQVNNLLPETIRHVGLTVNINNEEYWYKDGIEDSNLVLKVNNIDTSNLVPYTGATQDVNIASNYFKTSKGFVFTLDVNNYFRTLNYGNYTTYEFYSKDNSNSNLGGIIFVINPEEGFVMSKTGGDGTKNIFQVFQTETYSTKSFVSEEGFKIPTGTANQSLTANGGVYDLDTKADLIGGKVPAWQLPSYVDDVLEFANLASFPATGESGKIYIAIDTNLTYRWSGSTYIFITSGAVDSVNGQTGVVNLTKSDIGLGNVENTSDADKPISTATQAALNNKQDKLSSYDESILIENDGNIEANVSLFEEYFEQQECELNFTPIQIVAVYQDGIKLLNSEYEIILPKKIKIKEYVDENIQIEYTHLKS